MQNQAMKERRTVLKIFQSQSVIWTICVQCTTHITLTYRRVLVTGVRKGIIEYQSFCLVVWIGSLPSPPASECVLGKETHSLAGGGCGMTHFRRLDRNSGTPYTVLSIIPLRFIAHAYVQRSQLSSLPLLPPATTAVLAPIPVFGLWVFNPLCSRRPAVCLTLLIHQK